MKYSIIKNSELEKGKRLDAEYYAPEFLNVETTLEKYPHTKPLAKLVKPIRTGFPFDSFTFSESGEIPLVRIRDIQAKGIDTEDTLYIPKKLALAHKEAIPDIGDVVIGMDGDEFRSAPITQDLGTVCINQRIAIITVESISTEYLFTFLNSKYGLFQLLRKKTTATTVGHISPRDVRELVVPIVTPESHDEITNKVRKSIELRKQADQLWEQAVSDLEKHIERSVASSSTRTSNAT